MKYIFVLFSFIVSNALGNDIVKIGYVDPVSIMEKAPQAEKARESMDKDFKNRRDEVINIRDQISEMESKLSAGDLDIDSNRDLLLKLSELKRDFRRKQDELKEDINIRRNQELSYLQGIIREAIIEIADADGYDLIVEQAVFASNSVDITNKVITKLSEKITLDEADSR